MAKNASMTNRLDWLCERLMLDRLLGLAGWFAIALAFYFLFAIRHEILGAPPDNRFSYKPDELFSIFSRWELQGRWSYIWSQVALDFLFPIVYGLFLYALCRIFIPRRFRPVAFGLCLAVLLLDYCENLLLIYCAANFTDSINPTATNDVWSAKCASVFTTSKWLLTGATLAILGLSVLWRSALAIAGGDSVSTTGSAFAAIARLRFPLLSLGALLAWSSFSISSGPLQAIAANLLLVENIYQILLLACVNGIAVMFAISIWRATWFYLDRRPDGQPWPLKRWPWQLYVPVTAIAIVTPLTAFHYSYQQDSIALGVHPTTAYATAAACSISGVLLGILGMLITGGVAGLLIGSQRGDGNFFPGEDRDQEALVWDLSKNLNWRFQVQIIFYAGVVAVCYFLVLDWFEKYVPWLSIATNTVILIWLVTFVLSGFAVWLDRSRIPVTLVIVLIIVIVRMIAPDEYPLPTLAGKPSSASTEAVKELVALQDAELADSVARPSQAQSEPADRESENRESENRESADRQSAFVDAAKLRYDELAWEVVKARMTNPRLIPGPDGGKTLVIITCPGGGIHAAAWAAHALEQLDRRYSNFSDSVCLISSVSGGSVGTLFFANSRYIEGSPNEALDGLQWQRAAASSLGEIGAGLTRHDVPSTFFPFVPGKDRGLRLEENWRSRLSAADDGRLASWGERALDGQMPIIVFNATDAASGRRILFSSVPVPRRESLDSRVGRPWDYRELLKRGFDVHAASAARASATFPYVSPFTKPANASSIGARVAICDGGFADNEGIVTAVDWLDFIGRRATQAKREGEGVPFRRILLLRIQPTSDFDEGQASTDARDPFYSQIRWLTGPLEALASMRKTSQVERGQLETDLATTYTESPWWDAAKAPSESSPTNPADELLTAQELLSGLPETQQSIYRSDVDMQRARVRSAKELDERDSSRDSRADRGRGRDSQTANSMQGVSPATTDPSSPSIRELDQPVLIADIPYVHADSGAIPLNWKLSPRQQAWYPRAWREWLTTAEAQAALQVAEGRDDLNVLQVLDALFLRRAASSDLLK